MPAVVETPTFLADAKDAGMGAGECAPLFLLSVFKKGDRSNPSKAEQNALRMILSNVAESYRQRGPQ